MMYGSWDIKCDEQMKWKNEKNASRYYHITLAYHKTWSYDVTVMRYQVRQTKVFVNSGYFLLFHPINNLKNQSLEKTKILLGDIIIFKWKSWCMVPEIWSVTDRMFCHFGQLFALLPLPSTLWKNTWKHYHFTHVNHKWKSYDVWYLGYGVGYADFLLILDHFLPFYPSNNPHNQNF